MVSSTNTVDEIKFHPRHSLLPDIELLSAPDEEDEDDLDVSTDFKNPEKELTPILLANASIATTSIPRKKSLSRSYKFVQLERTLTLANLLKTKDDRIKFQHDYLDSLRENKFEEFLKISYQKLQDHNEKLKRERSLKRSQTFTFVDLEKNFLAFDPSRDIKIVFIDDSTTSSRAKMTDMHSNTLIHKNSALSIQSDENDIETFYENRFHHLLQNPSDARDEITLFARRAGEHLHERLPHLSRVPHRIKIVDARETKGDFDKHTLIQLKHKHALSLITKRRQLLMKMMLQTKKNQNKMEQFNKRTPLILNNSSCCRELLERINQIEQMMKEEQLKRPQTDSNSRTTLSKTTNYSSIQTTTITGSITPSFSSCSTPFQDALSIHHVEKTNNVHVILPKRPLTAPIQKMAWINYC